MRIVGIIENSGFAVFYRREEETMNICRSCIRSNYIKDFLKNNRAQEDKECIICHEKASYDISNDREALEMMVNNIRYHYPIYLYFNGEDTLYTPKVLRPNYLMTDNWIFTSKLSEDVSLMIYSTLSRSTSIDDISKFLFSNDEVSDDELKWWTRYNYDEHYGKPLKDAKARLISRIEGDLQRMNHFQVSEKYMSIFNEIKRHIPSAKFIDKVFYRARKGFNRIEALVNDYPKMISFPYIKDEICSPPPMITQSGRFNRVGCSFLYVASNENTAVSEIRPEISERCTVADFKCISDSLFMDVRKESISNMKIEENLTIVNILESLNRLFSGPILSNESNKYLITQFLSDIIRSLGYSGVVYDSPQGDGYNITGFEDGLFKLVDDSERIVTVNKISYETSLVEDSDDRKKYTDIDFEKRILNKKYLGEEW